ncbi:hypothetical protein, partial [Sphaerisporangium fuscum]|uniref:hypothetical protein n=1 Tax=Sphaerisporangium fuscum TaxID=2835868 RepID=UPI001BDBFADC
MTIVLRRAALAAVAAWLLFALVNWTTGRFWWWGGAAPLLLFFTVPLLVLAAAAMLLLARARLPRRERVLVSLAAAALALAALRALLTGRTWLWVVPDLMVPPLLLVAAPLALLAAVAVPELRRDPLAGRARWAAPSLAVAALVLGVGQAGLNPPWGGGAGPA